MRRDYLKNMANNRELQNKLEKVAVNAGIGKLSTSSNNFEEKVLPDLIRDLSVITGQKPAPRPTRQSIAGFKIREGSVVGLKVTLRGRRMMDFIERLSKSALPRLRDFKGIDLKNVDKNGNLSIGLKEQTIFPEVDSELARVIFGLQITIVPKGLEREEAIELYRQLGIPLKKHGKEISNS